MTVVHDSALHDVLESRDLVPSFNWFVGGFLNGDFSDNLFFFNVHFSKLWEQTELLAV